MHPLLGKAIFRLLLFYAYGLFFAWVFTLIEKRDESSHHRMERLRRQLRNEIDIKYNMTDSDFERFVKKAEEAMLAREELDWTFLNTCGFAFAALTTVGKIHVSSNRRLPLRSQILELNAERIVIASISWFPLGIVYFNLLLPGGLGYASVFKMTGVCRRFSKIFCKHHNISSLMVKQLFRVV